MKTKKINVGKFRGVSMPFPEDLDELRTMVGTDEDLFYIAMRGFDQVRRTHLLTLAKREGTLKKEVESRAKNYWYTHQKNFELNLDMKQRG